MRNLFRQPSVTRITLNRELQRQYENLHRRGAGVVLDVGAKNAPYQDVIAATQYMTLDMYWVVVVKGSHVFVCYTELSS